MTSLVYVEHENGEPKAASLSAITAAQAIGADVHLLVAGENCAIAAEKASKVLGVSKVWVADHKAYEHELSENIAALVVSLAADYSHFLAAATTTGKSFLPRVAALLDVNMTSDVIGILNANTFEHPIYAGNAIETVESSESKVVLSVRSTAFDKAAIGGGDALIAPVRDVQDLGKSVFVKEELATSVRPDLTSASVVVSGGRALGSGENFQKYIEPLADKLGAAVGASRAAVDAGFVPNDLQVGQTGKIVAPDLYIAVGISGAIQHLAGMKDSKTIVAINNDPDSAIVGVADYFLQGDLFEVLPELTAKL